MKSKGGSHSGKSGDEFGVFGWGSVGEKLQGNSVDMGVMERGIYVLNILIWKCTERNYERTGRCGGNWIGKFGVY